ncbi:MAG: hypothetical protein ACLUI3_15810 [Christensenellales bacterium]
MNPYEHAAAACSISFNWRDDGAFTAKASQLDGRGLNLRRTIISSIGRSAPENMALVLANTHHRRMSSCLSKNRFPIWSAGRVAA